MFNLSFFFYSTSRYTEKIKYGDCTFYIIDVCKYVHIETNYIFIVNVSVQVSFAAKNTVLNIEYENAALLVALYTSCLKSWSTT